MLSGIARQARSFIRIKGPEAPKFLNGLMTTRLLPNVVKKKQHTISLNEGAHDISGMIDLAKNWGLMHEDIYDPEQRIWVRRDGLNSMILNSKGRVVEDCFLYAEPFHSLGEFHDEPSYLVETSPKYKMQLMSLFKIHKLSAKATIAAADVSSYYYYNDTEEFDEFLEHIRGQYFDTFDASSALHSSNEFMSSEAIFAKSAVANVVALAVDNRIPNFGLKIVTRGPVELLLLLFSESFKLQFPVQEVDEKVVRQRRYINGVFEYGDAAKGTSILPFEMNLDYTNGLSLEKGCYVGQELTIRTFNGGVIRKRVFPAELSSKGDLATLFDGIDLKDVSVAFKTEAESEDTSDTGPSSSEPAFASSSPDSASSPFGSAPSPFGSVPSPFGGARATRTRGKVAKLLAVEGNWAFLLASVDDVTAGKTFSCDVGGTEVDIKAILPDWWPETL